MSAPVHLSRTFDDYDELPTSHTSKRGVEPDARRRASATRVPGGDFRARGSVTRGAVAASLAEWGF